MQRLASAIDRFTDRTAVLFAWLLVPLLGTIGWEVAARYLLGAPTRWAYETIYMLCGAMFMLGAAYALRAGAHIRTDFLWEKWPPRTRALIDAAGYLLLFFPGMALFLAAGLEAAWASYALDERSAETSWFPPLWPLKAIVPASAALLLAQGVAEFVRALHTWRTGEELPAVSVEALTGLAMLAVMMGAIFIGFPVAFTLLVLAFAFGALVLGTRVFDLAFFQTTGLMRDELMAAVPLFVFMGYLVEQAGLMERLFLALRLALAPVRGSLLLVVILTATVFAMATGIVGAAVPVLGLMAAPIMLRAGYDAPLAAGAITAGGTLGILIPPSVMLLVLGPVIGVSVADLYAAAMLPGFLLAGLYLAYVMVRCHFNPRLGPPLPPELRAPSLAAVAREAAIGVLPLAVLVASTLGSILAGLATPTEAAGVGAFGALALAAAHRRLDAARLHRALMRTLATTSMVLFLAVASNIFGAVFARFGTATWITEWLLGVQLPPVLMLVLVVVLIFLLGWPFEWPAIVFVFVPIFYPVVVALGIDMVWFGALVALTLQTAFLSPPVAMSGYFLKQVAPAWTLADIFRGMSQFMAIQIAAIALLLAVPPLATWLPGELNRTSAERALRDSFFERLPLPDLEWEEEYDSSCTATDSCLS